MKRWVFLGLAALVSLTLAACGGDSEKTADPAVGHSESEDADSPEDEGEGVLHVSLSEWSVKGAHKGEKALAAGAGDVVFEIHNDGVAPHDLVIIKTNLAPDALPAADGAVNPEAAGEVIGSIDPLPGDIEVEEPYYLAPGRYVLICSIPGHYEQGMFAELTVE